LSGRSSSQLRISQWVHAVFRQYLRAQHVWISLSLTAEQNELIMAYTGYIPCSFGMHAIRYIAPWRPISVRYITSHAIFILYYDMYRPIMHLGLHNYICRLCHSIFLSPTFDRFADNMAPRDIYEIYECETKSGFGETTLM
jgi:hypothetical protein